MHTHKRGAAGQQYAIVIGLIAVIAISAIASAGTAVRALFGSTSNTLIRASNGLGAAGGSETTAPAGTATLVLSGNGNAMNVTGPGNPALGSPVNFTLSNTGTASSDVPVVTVNPTTNFTITSNGCTASLSPSGSCTITVRPQATADGTYSATLSVAANNNPTLALGGTASGYSSALTSCQAWRDLGYTVDGSYLVDPDGAGSLTTPANAYCDMDNSPAIGWTLMAYNDQPTTFTYFNKNWASYKAGFGGPTTGSLSIGWLGNDRLNALTVGGKQLRVLVGLTSSTATHLYEGFTIANETNRYRMTFNTTGSPLADDFDNLAYHNNRDFFTSDFDTGNCANTYKAGWWYGACYRLSLAGNDGGRVYWRDNANGVQSVQTNLSFWIH